MISKNINFIGAQTQRKLVIFRQFNYFKKVMIGIFAICLVSFCIILIMKTVQQQKSMKLLSQVKKVELQIDGYRKTESLITIIKSRVELINTSSLTDQGTVSRSLDLIAKIMENGFQPRDNIKIGTASEIRVEGDVSNAASLSQVTSTMDNLQSQKYFNKYQINSIQRQDLGSYSVAISLF